MTEIHNLDSEYLCDQGKRNDLLEYLVSMSEGIHDLATALLDLQHGGMTEPATFTCRHGATIAAMNVLADWVSVEPMLRDMYRDIRPSLTPDNLTP